MPSNATSKGVFGVVSKTPFSFRKIAIVGTTGSGKTTLAARLARCFQLKHIELDALHWETNWQEVPNELFRARVEDAIRAPAWVMDRNYSAVRPLVLSRADTLLWLDYPLALNFWRLFSRTLRRAFSREVIWGNNVEPFWIQWKLWSDDSIFHWFFKTYWRRKREYAALFENLEYAHLKKFRFRSPRETEAWIREIECASKL